MNRRHAPGRTAVAVLVVPVLAVGLLAGVVAFRGAAGVGRREQCAALDRWSDAVRDVAVATEIPALVFATRRAREIVGDPVVRADLRDMEGRLVALDGSLPGSAAEEPGPDRITDTFVMRDDRAWQEFVGSCAAVRDPFAPVAVDPVAEPFCEAAGRHLAVVGFDAEGDRFDPVARLRLVDRWRDDAPREIAGELERSAAHLRALASLPGVAEGGDVRAAAAALAEPRRSELSRQAVRYAEDQLRIAGFARVVCP